MNWITRFAVTAFLTFAAAEAAPTSAPSIPAQPNLSGAIAQVSPRMLTWRVGEKAAEKTAEIVVPANAEKLTTVKTHRRMRATLEQVDATHYRVHVTPVSTEKHEQPTPILIGSGEHPKKGPQIVVYAQVVGNAATAKPPHKS